MLHCNQCKSVPTVGASFKTSCNHLLCENCANQAFSSDCFCPVCKERLQAQDVSEILVGVPPISMQDNLFQVAFQEPSMSSIISNTSRAIQSVTELAVFVHAQLADQIDMESSEKDMLQKNAEAIKNETARSLYQMREQGVIAQQRIQLLEQQLVAKNDELNELKEAYKSKLKKCEAWEKAYYSIKEQASGKVALPMVDASLVYGTDNPVRDHRKKSPQLQPCSIHQEHAADGENVAPNRFEYRHAPVYSTEMNVKKITKGTITKQTARFNGNDGAAAKQWFIADHSAQLPTPNRPDYPPHSRERFYNGNSSIPSAGCSFMSEQQAFWTDSRAPDLPSDVRPKPRYCASNEAQSRTPSYLVYDTNNSETKQSKHPQNQRQQQPFFDSKHSYRVQEGGRI